MLAIIGFLFIFVYYELKFIFLPYIDTSLDVFLEGYLLNEFDPNSRFENYPFFDSESSVVAPPDVLRYFKETKELQL